MNNYMDIVNERQQELQDKKMEMDRRAAYAHDVLQTVYKERTEQLEAMQQIITTLLEEGDFEVAMAKIKEMDEYQSASPNAEIKRRLSEYHLVKRD